MPIEPVSPRPLLFGIFKRTSPPVFAGSALHLEPFEGAGIAAATAEDVSSGLFLMFDQLPLSWPLGAAA